MRKKIVVNDAFIKEWHPRYDEKNHGEDKYKIIMAIVKQELSNKGTLLKKTFKEIYYWKAARAWWRVDSNNFGKYTKKFRSILQTPEDQKIKALRELPGIGIPVASTILHFMYPEIFPIVDFRTVEVLQYANQLDESRSFYHFRDTLQGYSFFRRTIAHIAKQHPRWSFRQIDRALFAYHKIEFQPMVKLASPMKKLQR